MINISKYKLLGALVGTSSGAYGSYEVYNHYGRKQVVANGSVRKKGIEVEEKLLEQPVVEEAEEPVEDDEESSTESEVRESIQKIEESEAKEQAPQPVELSEKTKDEKKLEPEKIEQPSKSVVVSPQPKNPTNSNQRNRRNSSSVNFTNSDGSIIIRPGTIGNQFKDYLITSTTDVEVWKQKVHAWSEDIKYFQERQRNGRYLNALPSQFIPKREETPENKGLQKRCYTAYNKNKGTWTDMPTDTKRMYNPATRAREYWEIVWKYCGQPKKEMPAGWYIK